MKKQIYLIIGIMMLIGIFSIINVNADLGNFPVNSIVPIRVLANCSSINLTEVTNNNGTIIINEPMTYLGGQTFIYYFNQTSVTDKYTYSWNNPCIDCSSDNCGNSFNITSGDIGFYIMITIIVVGILLIGIFIKNIPITMIGSLCNVAWGIFIFINGFSIFRNLGTEIFSIVVLAFGFYWGFQAMGEYLDLL